MSDEVALVLDPVELALREEGEFGGESEMVGEGEALSSIARSLGVADASVISGTPCPCRVPGCNRTLSMSLVETARTRLAGP